MILVDVNLLLYAANEDSEFHAKALDWWEATVNSGELVFLSWVTIIAYLRIATLPNSKSRISSEVAVGDVGDWLMRPNVRIANPGPSHFEIYSAVIRDLNLVGSSMTDGFLAALAMEFDLALCSSDLGFARYPKLRWQNPLSI
jgi:toxin-antitoxin system PIN domain toxin